MPSTRFSSWTSHIKTTFVSSFYSKSVCKESGPTPFSHPSTPSKFAGSNFKRRFKLPWLRRAKSSEVRVFSCVEPEINIHAAQYLPIVDPPTSSGFGSIRSFLRDFEVVSSGQGPHQHRRLSFCDFSDSDDESLFDNYCGPHSFHVWSPQSQTRQYRLHYGPHIENIENQFEQHDDLFKDPSADDLATDEQEFQELDDEVAQTMRRRLQRPMSPPNMSDETLCETREMPEFPLELFLLHGSESNPPTSHREVIGDLFCASPVPKMTTTPSNMRSYFSRSLRSPEQYSSRSTPTQHNSSIRSPSRLSNVPSSFYNDNERRLCSLESKIRYLERTLLVHRKQQQLELEYQQYHKQQRRSHQQQHAHDESPRSIQHTEPLQRLMVSRSRLPRCCSIEDVECYNHYDDSARDDVRSPTGSARTPAWTTFCSWLQVLDTAATLDDKMWSPKQRQENSPSLRSILSSSLFCRDGSRVGD